MIRIHLTDILQTSLKCSYYFDKNPEILEIDLGPTLVISGLQRTGTTMLHRLLSHDQETRTLKSWEVLSPAPHLGSKRGAKDPRIREGKQKAFFVKYIDPAFHAIHAVEYHEPEEEILLLDNTILSTTWEAMMHVPSFSAWLEEQDHTIAYQYLRDQIKLLMWQEKKPQLLMKTPHHLEFLDYLKKSFPSIKAIQTHRDPIKTIASMCSLVSHTRRMFSDEVDMAEIGRHWLRKIQRMIDQSLEHRNSDNSIPFLDIEYDDLMDQIIPSIEKIYAHWGVELKDSTKEAFKIELDRRTRTKRERHSYRLEDYNISEDDILNTMKNYYSRFHKMGTK